MKARLLVSLVLSCGLLAAISHAAPPADSIPGRAEDAGVTARASADKSEAYIGDRIKYVVKVSAKPGVEIEFPKIRGALGPFVVKGSEASGPVARSTGTEYAQSYTLTIYTTGPCSIPGQEVRYRTHGAEWARLSTNAVPLQVKSLLAEDPTAKDIRDIKGILALPRNPFLWIAVWIAALGLASAVSLWLWKIFFLREKTLPPKPAHVIAYEELERIKMSGLIADGKVKEYYFRLSRCIRHYLENRFLFRAPEMTTEEFLIAARDSGKLADAQKASLKAFLSSADMVKFAKYGPTREEIDASFESAKRFIDETKEVEAR